MYFLLYLGNALNKSVSENCGREMDQLQSQVAVQKSAEAAAPARSFRRPTAAAQDRPANPPAGRGAAHPESKESISPRGACATGVEAAQSVRVALAPQAAARCRRRRRRQSLVGTVRESGPRKRGEGSAQSATSAAAQVTGLKMTFLALAELTDFWGVALGSDFALGGVSVAT